MSNFLEDKIKASQTRIFIRKQGELESARERVLGIKTFSHDRNMEFYETSTIDHNEKQELPTSKNYSFSFNFLLNPSSSVHMELLKLSKDIFILDYYPNGTENIGYSYPIFIESVGDSINATEYVETSCNFKGAGEMTILPVV